MTDLANLEEIVAVRMGDEIYLLNDREGRSHQHLATFWDDDGDLVLSLHGYGVGLDRYRARRLKGRASGLFQSPESLATAELLGRLALLD